MYEEDYPSFPSQRPYSLHGKRQKEEVRRITYENRKILRAVQDRQPEFNRNVWLANKIDSFVYNLNKSSNILV